LENCHGTDNNLKSSEEDRCIRTESAGNLSKEIPDSTKNKTTKSQNCYVLGVGWGSRVRRSIFLGLSEDPGPHAVFFSCVRRAGMGGGCDIQGGCRRRCRLVSYT